MAATLHAIGTRANRLLNILSCSAAKLRTQRVTCRPRQDLMPCPSLVVSRQRARVDRAPNQVPLMTSRGSKQHRKQSPLPYKVRHPIRHLFNRSNIQSYRAESEVRLFGLCAGVELVKPAPSAKEKTSKRRSRKDSSEQDEASKPAQAKAPTRILKKEQDQTEDPPAESESKPRRERKQRSKQAKEDVSCPSAPSRVLVTCVCNAYKNSTISARLALGCAQTCSSGAASAGSAALALLRIAHCRPLGRRGKRTLGQHPAGQCGCALVSRSTHPAAGLSRGRP